ncbi:hypothetical protein LPB86_11600 [Pedobacter sp. MC2016-14]|uniref:hypothetical protein n=1 Tax=Pedobacter sp. MC2016-14 TaxID=2897327 RepID=UPI001E4A7493|nr:hypothetical protein [Pedobacter sp. MC2016-14]MCD0488878.1 hypothetical protein [Pedobacter sp. MC2016-14]
MKYRFLIIATLISFAAYAQKKPVKKNIPPPPPPVRRIDDQDPATDPKNPFPENITFKWKIQPATLTTLTPTDVFEKSYTFNGRGRNVRISTVYPKDSFEYKKPNADEIEMAQTLVIRYKDYKNVTIAGNIIKIVSDDGKEEIKLQLSKKGSQLTQIKELSTNKVFMVTDSYAGEPTIGL